MRMVPIMWSAGESEPDENDDPDFGGLGFNPMCIDGQKFIPEDEALAGGILSGTRALLQFEKKLEESPSLTEEEKQVVLSHINHSKAFIHKRWIKMEDPTFVLTLFLQDRADGKAFQDVDSPRWIEALTWSPERIKELETESSEA